MWGLRRRRRERRQAEEPVVYRVMLPGDVDEASALDRRIFGYRDAWTTKDFVWRLCDRHGQAYVAEIDGCIVGYIVLSAYGCYVNLDNLAVDWDHRRQGIGRGLMGILDWRLRDRAITMHGAALVRESNLDAQLFLQALGWERSETLHAPYITTDEDGYLFGRTEEAIPAGSGGQVGPVTA